MFRRFSRGTDGQAAIQFGLIVAIIAISLLAVMNLLRADMLAMFENIYTAMTLANK